MANGFREAAPTAAVVMGSCTASPMSSIKTVVSFGKVHVVWSSTIQLLLLRVLMSCQLTCEQGVDTPAASCSHHANQKTKQKRHQGVSLVLHANAESANLALKRSTPPPHFQLSENTWSSDLLYV